MTLKGSKEELYSLVNRLPKHKEVVRMARITCEDCLDRVGKQNRFKLIHLTVERVKQHRQGEPFLVEGKNKEIVMTLREIAAGKVSFENIKTLPDAPDSAKASNEDESDSLLVTS